MIRRVYHLDRGYERIEENLRHAAQLSNAGPKDRD